MSRAFGRDAGRKQTNAVPLWRPTDSQSESDRREKRGYMKTVHTLTALNYRADYSGRMALDSGSHRAAKTRLFMLILMIIMIVVS